MVNFPRSISKKRKVQYKSKYGRRSVSRVSRTYSPYKSIRGTNPENHVSFRGKGFPDKLTTNLVYSDSFILDPSAGTICPFKTYLMTSCFDPDFALGGGQPTYFDQLAIIYSRYKVNGAKISAHFSRSTTTASSIGPYICGIQMSDASGIPSTNASALISTPNTGYKVVSQDDGTQVVAQTYSSKNTFPDFSDSLQARTNANPVINWYAKVFASPQGVDVEAPINVVITIEYNVTFSDVIQVVDV